MRFIDLLARALMAQIFIIAGWGKLGAGYAGTEAYMQSVGLPGFLLPLVILLELGGGIAASRLPDTPHRRSTGAVLCGKRCDFPPASTRWYANDHVHEKHRNGRWSADDGAIWRRRTELGSQTQICVIADEKLDQILTRARIAGFFLFYQNAASFLFIYSLFSIS